MGFESIRVLVVDDFGPVRRMISSTLKRDLRLQNICEACDGQEAIAVARKWQPDLILLDIGLPKINGLQAARQIRQCAPESRILFVTQESAAEILKEAFEIGASGYVLKTDADRELIAAPMTVLHGERFVSRSLAVDDRFCLDCEES